MKRPSKIEEKMDSYCDEGSFPTYKPLTKEEKAWNDCHKAHDPYIAYQEQRIKELEDSVGELVDGYKDAVSGLKYIQRRYTHINGVGFDRVFDKYEELLAKHQKKGVRDES